MSKLANGFDRNNAKELSDAVVAALSKVEREFGVKFTQGGGTFGETRLTMKIVADIQLGPGSKLEPTEVKLWNMSYAHLGLKKSWLGKTVMLPKHGKAKIIGLLSRGKLRVLLENPEGNRIRVSTAYLINLMA